MHATLPLLLSTDFPPVFRAPLETLQVNLGYRCNQSCLHCHVNAGPKRTEEMGAAVAEAVIAFMDRTPGLTTLDITGGAPELNAQFRPLVEAGRARGLRVMDRCNLTILEEPDQGGLAEFLAAHRVEIVASLPCYLEENVDRQRGKGVFDASLRGLRRLNDLGYGRPGSGLVLNLVYNPQGPSLPPPQAGLQADYKRHLAERYGLAFNELFTLANMPIARFGSTLISHGQFNAYLDTLRNAHRMENLAGVMCRTLLSVDWQGWVYDCDFNQQLGIGLPQDAGVETQSGEPGHVAPGSEADRADVVDDLGVARTHIRDLDGARLAGRGIRVAEHCYGCTAGQGSSCGGALAGA